MKTTYPYPPAISVSSLKGKVSEAGHNPYFFTRSSMSFFGDSMGNYGVLPAQVIKNNRGETSLVYELFRKRPVKHGLKDSTFFDCFTFKRVFPA